MADKDINQIEDQRYKDGLCMRPWTGDDGTQKNCIENGHCGCVAKDKKSPSDPGGYVDVGTCTSSGVNDKPFTADMLTEAMELIKALAPKEAPDNCLFVKGVTGLNIMKNNMLPENTIMVSKRLFDLIYESSST